MAGYRVTWLASHHVVVIDHRKKDVLPTAKKSLAVKGDLT
jgi:hypothetical protein